MPAEPLSGAEIVIKALVDQGVDVVFGYPGGAVLPIYDALFKQKTAYEIRIRDWSSDVCSSDLNGSAGMRKPPSAATSGANQTRTA